MSEPLHIRRFRVQHFGCVQDCELKLSRLHALVGPNDSGKSTLLRALASSQRLFDVDTTLGGQQSFEIEWSDGVSVQRRDTQPGHQPPTLAIWCKESSKISEGPPGYAPLPGHKQRLGEPRVLRLDPEELRRASELIPSAAGVVFASERGAGLPSVYDALLARRRRAFDAIEKHLIDLFPQVEALVLLSVSSSRKQLAAQLRDRPQPVSADALSEGLLYFLAFAALPYLEPTPLVLIEEPENGLHPARIGEVVRVLREVSKTMQVVVATHSPLVVNELEGNEVSVVTRDSAGTHAVVLSDTPRYGERSSVYKNGELWLGYSDGEQEKPLLQGTAGS